MSVHRAIENLNLPSKCCVPLAAYIDDIVHNGRNFIIKWSFNGFVQDWYLQWRFHSLTRSHWNALVHQHVGWSPSGGHLIMKTLSYQYRNSNYKDKMVSQPSYLHVNPCTWKDSLYIETGPGSGDLAGWIGLSWPAFLLNLTTCGMLAAQGCCRDLDWALYLMQFYGDVLKIRVGPKET